MVEGYYRGFGMFFVVERVTLKTIPEKLPKNTKVLRADVETRKNFTTIIECRSNT